MHVMFFGAVVCLFIAVTFLHLLTDGKPQTELGRYYLAFMTCLCLVVSAVLWLNSGVLRPTP